MIITHNIPWDKCLSKQLFPAIEKGWTDSDKPIHFFWGLAGVNQKEISKCMDNNEEWWYVDVGYLTQQITRYPEPKIHDYDKTYFRICKGNLHTNRFKASHGRRLGMLEYQGIDVEFKGWKTGETKHILLCPSSPTVTFNINGITQDQWVEQVTNELKEYTDMPIKFRNKPRPNNEWWNIDIKDDLKDCHCLVTNMSLSAIDAILNMTPAITHQRNISALVTSRDLKFIKKPFKPGRKTVNEWLKMVADNQFTLEEIGNGTAYRTLREQNV
jgi:hypothetical protein